MRITVVIPAYSHPLALLERAVASVPADSSGIEFEIIVVDDAAVEPVVLPSDADPRVRVVRRAVNGGVAAAQNTGLDHATGDAVVFLHSDDELAPGRFPVQAAVLDEDPATEWVGSLGFDGEEPRDDPMVRATPLDMLWRTLGVHISPYLFRRSTITRLRFDEGLRCREDWDLLFRLKKSGVPFRSTDVVGSYRPGLAAERLSDSVHMADALVHLRGKYFDDLAADRRLLAHWDLRIAALYARFDDAQSRRRSRHWYLESVRRDPLHPRRLLAAGRAVLRAASRVPSERAR